jgi:hypothetical protein
MNETTKKLMLQMAKVCEEFYYQSCVYQAVLHTYGRSGWREHAETALRDSKSRARVHEIFEPVYTKIQAAEGLEAEIETLLRNLPPSGTPS